MPPGWQGVVARSNRFKLEFGVVNGLAETRRMRLKGVVNVVALEDIIVVQVMLRGVGGYQESSCCMEKH